MKTSLVTLLAVLCVGVAARFGYRFVVDEMVWRTDKATYLGMLTQAEMNRQITRTLGNYPTEPGAEQAMAYLEADINRMAELEVIDAKQALLWLYEKRGRALSAEEKAQASGWGQDMAAWKAKEAEKVRRRRLHVPCCSLD